MPILPDQISTAARRTLHFVGLLLFLTTWSALTYGGFVRDIFLPKPSDVLFAFVEMHQRGWLLAALFNSVMRIVLAMLAAILLGIPLGLLMGISPRFDALTIRLLHAIKSVPVTGLMGLIVLWFGFNELGKLSFLFFGIVFYMIILVRNAVQSVNPMFIKVAIGLGGDRSQIVRRVILPAVMPQVLDAIVVCNGLCWTYIVLAEFLGANEARLGLGYIVYISSRTQNSAMLFGALVLIGIVSSLSDYVLTTTRRYFFNW